MNLWVWISEELQELSLERANDKPKGPVPGVDVSTLGMAVFMRWVEKNHSREQTKRGKVETSWTGENGASGHRKGSAVGWSCAQGQGRRPGRSAAFGPQWENK